MAETALISITDVRVYRQIDSKFDTTRFNSFCMEIQRVNLRNLLGDALYQAFMSSDRTNGIYADLLNGKDYSYNGKTIHFYGVKPILCYWWLALATKEGDLFLGTIGAIQFVNNQQQSFESYKDKMNVVSSFSSIAQGYANDLIQFLGANASDYPLWNNNQSEVNQSNFVSFRL